MTIRTFGFAMGLTLLAAAPTVEAQVPQNWVHSQSLIYGDRYRQLHGTANTQVQSAPRADRRAYAALAGVYFCRTAPAGCQTRLPIRLDGGGAWSWGAQRGFHTVSGNRIQFGGASSWSPAGWGPAALGRGTLTFYARNGASTWAAAGR